MPDNIFESIVSHFIGNQLRPPVLKDFAEKYSEYEQEQCKNRPHGGFGSANLVKALEHLADKSDPTLTNKEFVKERIRLLGLRVSNKLTQEQFEQGLDLINQATKGKI